MAIAAKLPAAPTTASAWAGMSRLEQPDSASGQAAAEGDQRGLRAEHGAERQGGQRGEQDAGQLGRRRCAGL